jgi:hypothetical protein
MSPWKISLSRQSSAQRAQHRNSTRSDSLKLKLEAELNLTPTLGQHLGDSRTSGTINNSRGAASAARSKVRKLEVRVVEEVKELSSEDQSKSLAQLECLVGRKIKVHQVRTAQYGASCVPE